MSSIQQRTSKGQRGYRQKRNRREQDQQDQQDKQEQKHQVERVETSETTVSSLPDVKKTYAQVVFDKIIKRDKLRDKPVLESIKEEYQSACKHQARKRKIKSDSESYDPRVLSRIKDRVVAAERKQIRLKKYPVFA